MSEPPLLDLAVERCSIARTIAIGGGDRWMLLVLREVFSGVRRFDVLQSRTGAPRQVLADRLGGLVDEGILKRVPYREAGQRTRHEYRLTEAGIDFYPVLVALMAWGDRWRPPPGGPAVALHHRGCGATVEVGLICAEGHRVGSAREVTPEPLPPVVPGRDADVREGIGAEVDMPCVHD